MPLFPGFSFIVLPRWRVFGRFFESLLFRRFARRLFKVFSATYFFSQRTVFCVAEVFKKCYSLKSSPHLFLPWATLFCKMAACRAPRRRRRRRKKKRPPVFFLNFFSESSVSFFFFGSRAPAARGRPPSRKTVAAKESVHRHKNKNPPPQKSQKNHRFALIFSKNTTRILWPPFREKFGKNFKNRQNRPEPLLHKKGKFGTVLNFFIRLSKSF